MPIFLRESTKPCTFLGMTAESALSSRHYQEGIGRKPATEMERSGIAVRSTASGREAKARDRDGAKRNRGAQPLMYSKKNLWNKKEEKE